MTNLIEIKRELWSPKRRIAIIGIDDSDYIVDKTHGIIRRVAVDSQKIDYLMQLPTDKFARHAQAILEMGRIAGFKGVEEACR